jgi:site-specific recombinase XerC
VLKAVQTLRVRRGTGTDQGVCNHALLAALLGSGLRVSDMVHLERDQSTGKGWTCVQTKGGVMRDGVPLHRDARQVLDAWRTARQDASPALFPTRTGRKRSRREASGIIQRLAAHAHAHLPEEEHMEVAAHVLRHTFLRKRAGTTGVRSARDASGHPSDRSLWRAVTPDQQTLAEAIDALEERNHGAARVAVPRGPPCASSPVARGYGARPGHRRGRREGASLAGAPGGSGTAGRVLVA